MNPMKMTTIKVIHIIGGGEYGGAEDHIIHLLKQLKPRQIEPQVICFYDALFAKRLREAGIPVTVLDYPRFDPRLTGAISKVLKDEQPDIVHTHGVKANFFGRKAAGKVGVPLVVTTVHSLLRFDYENPFSYRMAKFLEDISRKKTDYYIAVSRRIASDLREGNVPAGKVQLISHGIDTDRFSPEPTAFSDELTMAWKDGDRDKILVGAVGRLQDVKGFSYFIDACARLDRAYPDTFTFVLIGDGPHKADLEQQVKKRKLGHVFRFAGFREDVDQCLKALDVYVSSSLSEGLGLAVMEALASGTPVITTGVGGVLDFAEDGRNALVIKEGDADEIVNAVVRIKDEPELGEAVALQGVEDIQNRFSLDKMGEETSGYYRSWLLQKQHNARS